MPSMISVYCLIFPPKASEGSDSEKAERRRFELHYDSLNDNEEKSNVPTGLEMFSAYRQGILNPDIVSTQAATSKVGEGKKGNEPNTSGAVRVPPAWLKPRGVLGRLASGHVSTTTSIPSSSSAPAISIAAAQKIAYEPPSTPTKAEVPVDSKNLLVSQRQRGNPLLELIRHVTWEYAAVEPDYVFGPSQCAFFLSLRYHNLNPEYIFKRLQKLKSAFQLVVLIVLVDVDDAHHPLKELNKFGLTQNVTVLLAWSFLEAARYVECFKALVNKPPEELQPEAAIATAQKDQLTLATDFFTSLRVVSRSDAAALLSRFGTVSDIIRADRKMLESCPGIGTVKAEKIYEALHSSLKRRDFE
ncbi:DNA excision repair protein ERCC-1 [Taenia crassiceps]|uniref:DNA excision repair protein ERCC-1 n=1 Tax=Taenia crassiceps TaxID=6207 RepID=A0ABR4QAH4_9CEST